MHRSICITGIVFTWQMLKYYSFKNGIYRNNWEMFFFQHFHETEKFFTVEKLGFSILIEANKKVVYLSIDIYVHIFYFCICISISQFIQPQKTKPIFYGILCMV